MKTKSVLIAVSLAANVALALAFFRSAPTTHQPSAAPIQPFSVPDTTAAAWTDLRSSTANDDAALIARLRVEGFPPAVIRSILGAQIDERFAPRRRELENATGEFQYWRNWSSIRSGNPQARAELRRLQREESDLLHQLLGSDADSPGMRRQNELKFGDLPKEKLEQVGLIARDYQDLFQQIQNEARGLLLPEDKERLKFLVGEQQKDLAAVLTPTELENYELRASRTANSLKGRLTYFDATEQEYVTIHRLQKAFDDRFSPFPVYSASVSSSTENKERSEAQKQLAKEIEAALGPARYADYKITTDFEFREAIQLTERLGLPANVAKNIVGTKLEVTDRLNTIRSDRSLDKAQREAQRTALSQEVINKLTQQLGAVGFAAYRDSRGYWINNIAPAASSSR